MTRVKDGTNFCSVSVGAVQRDKVCFHCLVSFQKPEAVRADLRHAARPMPVVPHPRDHVNTESLSDADLFTVDTKRFLTDKHRWQDFWPCDMYLCTDVSTAKKQLAREPTKPRLVLLLLPSPLVHRPSTPSLPIPSPPCAFHSPPRPRPL